MDEPGVLSFLNIWNLNTPSYLEYVDEGWGYEPDFCHVSAKHVALHHGGVRVHGWALWKWSFDEIELILGNFHSVWERPGLSMVDVTPPKDKGSKTLFVRDASLVIRADANCQLLYNNRTTVKDHPYVHLQNPTPNECFAILNTDPTLVAYCKKLGLADTSMI
jgi:hypothetical protein